MSAGTPQSFLGTGWSFPPEFGPGGAEVALVSDGEDVHQALAILFATRTGERPMQETFGCNLDEVLFEEIDQHLVNRITSMINDAILQHEPRIELLDVDVSPDPDDAGVLRIRLEYAVLGTNSRYNMVFPFYLNEAVTPGL
jgi:phage baseplate assembly protein W